MTSTADKLLAEPGIARFSGAYMRQDDALVYQPRLLEEDRQIVLQGRDIGAARQCCRR